MKRSFFWLGITALAGYTAYRFWAAHRAALDAPTISDSAGNYDIDGVSYDREAHEVVVSGDRERGGGSLLH